MNKKVQLIHPPNDLKYADLRTGYQSYPPPTGLLILAAYVKKYLSSVVFEIFDGNFTPISKILENLDGDIIGISDWFTNHDNALLLAKKAKEKNRNCIVVLGGPNASNLGDRILINNYFVDYVVNGDGEIPLLEILENKKPQNTWYRNELNEIEFNQSGIFEINSSENFNYNDLFETDIEKYDSRKEGYFDSIDRTPIPISSIRGCIKAVKEGLCSYCSIPMLKKVRVMQPKKVWEQIFFLYENYGITKYFETGDNFTVGDYPERLLEAKPKDLKIGFRIYAIPGTISENNIDILKRLGVEEIFIGMETTDSNILRNANKNVDIASMEHIIALLKETGIRVFLPFLFGLPGETKNSLTESYSYAKYLIDKYDNIQRLLFSLAIPLIGTPWFNQLSKNRDILEDYNEDSRSLLRDDRIEYERLFLLSLKYLSEVKFKEIYEVLSNPLPQHLHNRVGGFGCLENKVLDLEIKINESKSKVLI